MKNIILLLTFQLLLPDIRFVCSDDLFSKLHQHGYKIKDMRMELPRYNEKYFNFFHLRTFKYNRTTPAVNASFNLKIPVYDKIEVVVQVYKFYSNEYRRFPVRMQLNLKKGFHSNAIGLQNVKNCGNVTDMFFEKDVTYHICNFAIDETQFPPLIPNGKFRMNFKFTYLDEEICLIYLFDEVYIPIKYPQK